MNTLIQVRHNHKESCITIKVSRRMQKVEIYLVNKGSDPEFFSRVSRDLGHLSVSNFVNDVGVMFRRKGLDKPEFAYDVVGIHCLMIYTDLTDCIIFSDTKSALLRCFPSTSKLKAGDIRTTGPYMNYQTFSDLKFRPLLETSFQGIHIELRDMSSKKIPIVSVGITLLVLVFKKVSKIQF